MLEEGNGNGEGFVIGMLMSKVASYRVMQNFISLMKKVTKNDQVTAGDVADNLGTAKTGKDMKIACSRYTIQAFRARNELVAANAAPLLSAAVLGFKPMCKPMCDSEHAGAEEDEEEDEKEDEEEDEEDLDKH